MISGNSSNCESFPHWQHVLVLSLLFSIAAALYFPVSQFEFQDYDDTTYILDDPAIQKPGWNDFKKILFEPHVRVWYPVARLSAALDIFIFGHNAFGHHLVNVLIHALNAVMIFYVFLVLGKHLNQSRQFSIPKANTYAALLVALLFVTHPQHVEAVAWVVQRKELLATLFSLIAITLYLKGRTFSVGIILILAILSKPTAVVLPFFLILLTVAMIEPKELSPARITRIVLSRWWAIIPCIAIAVLVMINNEKSLWLNSAFSLYTRCLLYADNALHGLSSYIASQPVDGIKRC